MIGTDRHLALTTITWIALAGLFLIIGLCQFTVAGAYDQLVAFIPEFAPDKTSLVVLAIAFGACIQAALVMVGILIGFIQADRMFDRAALVFVDALLGAIGLATLVLVPAFTMMPAPPFAALMIAGIAFGITVMLILVLLRALLRRATLLHVELEEVV